MEVALKLAGSALDPLQLTFLRFTGGGIVLLPFGVAEMRRKGARLTPGLLGYYLLLGTLCVPLSMVLFQYGILYSNAATAAVLFCTNPIATAVLAHFFAKDDKLTKGKVLSVLITIPGILLMIRPWDLMPGNTIHGALLSIGAGVLFSLYGVLGTRSIQKAGPFTQTAMSFLLGAAVLLAVLIATGRPVTHGVIDEMPLVLYTAVVVSGVGYLTYFFVIKHANATTASIIFLLKPAIAPVIAVVVLGERISWNMVAGIVLILAASGAILAEKRRDSKT